MMDFKHHQRRDSKDLFSVKKTNKTKQERTDDKSAKKKKRLSVHSELYSGTADLQFSIFLHKHVIEVEIRTILTKFNINIGLSC